MTPFASLSDLEARHPEQLGLLAADEATGERDDVRVERALSDATAEIRAILYARYTPADLDRLDETSVEILRVFCMDVALYRVSVSFARSSEILKERYEATIARLRDIAKGAGGLVVLGVGGATGDLPGATEGSGGPNEVIVVANERLFTRERFGRA